MLKLTQEHPAYAAARVAVSADNQPLLSKLLT